MSAVSAETAETQLDELVDELIEEENYLCYDVVSNHGQMFDNVKHTKWFREALKEHIQETEKKSE